MAIAEPQARIRAARPAHAEPAPTPPVDPPMAGAAEWRPPEDRSFTPRAVLRRLVDAAAVTFGVAASPALKMIADHHASLPRFQALADRMGVQIRSNHYYEPTYRERDLPAVTSVERSLPGLDLNAAGQLALLADLRYADELEQIPIDAPAGGSGFHYRNGQYECGDAEIFYSLVRRNKPRRIVEIGAGHSTKLAALAIEANRREDPAYSCRQTCVEPFEADWLEALGVSVIRKRVETLDPSIVDTLTDGDMLFVDSSHVIRPWGDVLFEFQTLIPRTAPGVWVHIHDVYTPRDYPEPWLRRQRRLWTEQYLMESFLTFNADFEVICAVNWLKHNHFAELSAACPILARYPKKQPGAFWFRRKAR